jgi:uncharacterized protein (DUF58 family)
MMNEQVVTTRLLHERPDAHQQPGIYVTVDELATLQMAHARIDLKARKKSLAQMAGQHHSAFRGRGIDFDEVRIYSPGDDVRNIDWRVTARTGKPHTKLFREERERPVYLVVDQSQSMFFGSRQAFKSVVAARTAAILAWAARRDGDRVGGFLFNDQQGHDLRPKEGKRGIQVFLRLLVQYNQNLNMNAAPAPDVTPLNEALQGLTRVIRPGSLAFIISDFRHFDDYSLQHLTLLRRHSDLIALHIFDPLEQQLPPPGRYDFTDGHHSLRLDSGERELRKRFRLQFVEHHTRLREQLGLLAIPLIDISTADAVETILQRELGSNPGGRRR